MGSRVLITGGAGFIGSHLCEIVLERGCEVICLDNLATAEESNIEHLKGRPGFEFIRQDVRDFITVEGKLDSVVHLAALPSPVDYIERPIETLKVGSLGTLRALGVAKSNGASFLLASTSEVYGDPAVHPQVEDYWGNVNPVGPRSCYDESKRFAEALTTAYRRQHDIDVKIARIFNTYGPRMRVDDGRVLPAFMTRSLRGQSLIVHGDGSQTRSLCYVSDMVEGLYRLLLSDEHEPVNLGSPEEVTVLNLAKEILALTGSKSKIVFRPNPVGDDPKVRQPDISKARRILGWEPKVPRAEGLRRSLEFFEKLVAQDA